MTSFESQPRTAAGRALLAQDFGQEDEIHVAVEDILEIEAEAAQDSRLLDVDGSVWADVVREPETHEPALLTDEARAAVNRVLYEVSPGYFLNRSWIQPGPLLHD